MRDPSSPPPPPSDGRVLRFFVVFFLLSFFHSHAVNKTSRCTKTKESKILVIQSPLPTLLFVRFVVDTGACQPSCESITACLMGVTRWRVVLCAQLALLVGYKSTRSLPSLSHSPSSSDCLGAVQQDTTPLHCCCGRACVDSARQLFLLHPSLFRGLLRLMGRRMVENARRCNSDNG